jgi:hypothetical protein
VRVVVVRWLDAARSPGFVGRVTGALGQAGVRAQPNPGEP